jgi:acetyl esterase
MTVALPARLLTRVLGAALPRRVVDGRTLDPRVAALLTLAGAVPSLRHGGVTAARSRYRRTADLLVARPPRCERRDLEVQGARGPLRARRYAEPGAGPRPLLVWFHGGGWTVGDLDTHDAPCAALAVAARTVVVAVDYALAPERPFPAAPEDAWAATRDLAARAAELGADPARIGVGGDSAGGNLAAVVAQRAAREGVGLAAQLLVYPGVDASREAPSIATHARGLLLEREDIRWFKAQYLQRPNDALDPRASPLLASDLGRLRGLAPAVVVVAGFDPLRDEGLAYAALLQQAGVPVDLLEEAGLVHGFLHLTGAAPACARAARHLAIAAGRLLEK